MKINLFPILSLSLLALSSSFMSAMEKPRDKRAAQEPCQELQAESKRSRVEQEQLQSLDLVPASDYPLASLPGLPNELLLLIAENLLENPGVPAAEQLTRSAANIHNLLIGCKKFKPLLDDAHLAGTIIRLLAERYTQGNLVTAALALRTDAASRWLAQEIKEKLGINPDGTTTRVSTEILNSPEVLLLVRQLQLAFINAIEQDKADTLRFLLAYQPSLANWYIYSDENEESLLEMAIFLKKGDIVCLLLKSGAKITDADIEQTIHGGSIKLLEELISRGADITTPYTYDDVESSFLFWATTKEMAAYLIKNGLDINYQNGLGDTPLHVAVKETDNQMVDAFLELGAKVTIQNHEGNTPLHFAAKQNYFYGLQKLIDKGAVLEIQNAQGNTPFAEAIIANNHAAALFLLKRGAFLPTQIVWQGLAYSPFYFVLTHTDEVTSLQNYIELLELMVARGANVNELVLNPNTGELITLLSFFRSQLPSPRNSMIIKFLMYHGAHE